MIEIRQGKMELVLPELDADSFDSCCVDPPYHLTSIVKRFGAENAALAKSNGATGVYARGSAGFMGKQWDGGDVAFRPETWAKVLRVLRPGAYLCAFGSTRGYHRMACAAEDAGFIIHPMVSWIFASGFPKATNFTDPFDEKLLGFTEEDDPIDWAMSRSHWATYWEGWRYGGQALKPAIEPILVAQKPFAEPTGRENVLRHGTGALNIDACRIGYKSDTDRATATPGGRCTAKAGALAGGVQHDGERSEFERPEQKGRWPANVVHSGEPEVLDAFAKFGDRKSCDSPSDADPEGSILGGRRTQGAIYPGENGSAARFFFCGKAGPDERVGSHPTVKPVALMEWLVRLVTPPGGRVLDPFCGTGSTLVACDRLGFGALGIEQDAQTVADAHEKLKRMRARRMIGADASPVPVLDGQLGLPL